MVKEVIHTDQAAVTGAPLVQAVKLGNLVFCSGASPRDPKQGNRVVAGGFKAQAVQALANLISNAIEATPAGRSIHLRVADEGDRVAQPSGTAST